MELDISEKNEITFIVARSNNEKCILYYRDPTTEERVQYAADMVKKINGKYIDCSIENRLKNGEMILSGFPDMKPDNSKEFQFTLSGHPISCRSDSPHYRNDWKELIKKAYADLIMKMAYQVFEGTLIGDAMPSNLIEDDQSLSLKSSSSPQSPEAAAEKKEKNV